MKTRSYINSPSYRRVTHSTGEKRIIKLAWFAVGVGVLVLLTLGGFLNLEGNLPPQVQQSEYQMVGL